MSGPGSTSAEAPRLILGVNKYPRARGCLPDVTLADELIQDKHLATLNGAARIRTDTDTWTYEDLVTRDFGEQRWMLDGLIPDHVLAMLGGKKKIGKSWFALQLAASVASSSPFLGRETTRGSVVYLALEDGSARLARRLKRQAVSLEARLPLTFRFRFPLLDRTIGEDGRTGLDELRLLVHDVRPSLLVIDTLAAIKSAAVEENEAGPMADIGNALRQLAIDEQVTVLVVVHHGKKTGGDPGDDIRGSTATAAASDLNLGLYFTKKEGYKLRAEGRDIESLVGETLVFDKRTCRWESSRGARRAQVESTWLDALAALGGEADAEPVGQLLGRHRTTARRHLEALCSLGTVESHEVGTKIVYRLLSRKRRVQPVQSQTPSAHSATGPRRDAKRRPRATVRPPKSGGGG